MSPQDAWSSSTYLCQSGCHDRCDGVSDERCFVELQSAMTMLNFSPASLQVSFPHILQRLYIQVVIMCKLFQRLRVACEQSLLFYTWATLVSCKKLQKKVVLQDWIHQNCAALKQCQGCLELRVRS
jgi:hypothetical protein